MSRRLALLAFLIAAPQLLAAVSRSALTGRVTSGGQPVANATVTARSAALQHERTTVTGASGTYWLSALPPGEYEVTFAKTGMQSLTRRVTVALARIARADAKLEPSEDEETVTSTVTTISVGHDTAIASHRTSEELERLPIAVDIGAAGYLAPGLLFSGAGVNVDDVPVGLQPDLVQAETVDAMTLIRGAVPLEYDSGGAQAAIVARTRSGGQNLAISVRDTITTGLHHFLESAAGGAIVPQRLWFFGAGWSGTRANAFFDYENSGLEIKLTGQLDERQNLEGTFTHHERELSGVSSYGASLAALHHIAQWNPHLVTEVVASRAYDSFDTLLFPPSSGSTNALSAKGSHVFGDHVVTAGVDASTSDFADGYSLFVHDRWWMRRAVIHAGVRYGGGDLPGGYNPGGPAAPRIDENRIGAQLAAAYDLRGNGRHALTATATRHTFGSRRIDELTFGYIAALGATGSARADVIHRDYGGDLSVTSIIADASYRLFDRLEAGVNYTHNDLDYDPFTLPVTSASSANAWITMRRPVGSSALAATVAYRYTNSPFQLGFVDSLHAVDAALRYTFPIRRVAMTLAADAQNLFDRPAGGPRVLRGWVRVRL